MRIATLKLKKNLGSLCLIDVDGMDVPVTSIT